jgi:hypothetical protein
MVISEPNLTMRLSSSTGTGGGVEEFARLPLRQIFFPLTSSGEGRLPIFRVKKEEWRGSTGNSRRGPKALDRVANDAKVIDNACLLWEPYVVLISVSVYNH